MQINVVLIPDMELLDIAGPYSFLQRVPGWTVTLISADGQPVHTNTGMTLAADTSRDTAATADMLVIPGGEGISEVLEDESWLSFIRQQAASAQYVFAICTGSLLLGAAGLLQGRRAGCYWQSRELLTHFGATPSAERIVQDGKFYTSGGVTSGLDATLQLIADIQGQTQAELLQLGLEYDPQPPFPGGSPESSRPEIVDAFNRATESSHAHRTAQVIHAAEQMKRRN